MNNRQRVVLVILDGWGYREEKENNAIAQAKTPNFDQLWANNPHTLLEASGESVGLPSGQMGNSEVGHTIIGAGKTVYTDFAKISKAIEEKQFKNNKAFTELFAHVKKYNSTLHVKGLVGSGGVHSHSDHLYAFLKIAKEAGIEKIAIHAFTDGRDTPPQSAAEFLKELEKIIEEVGIGFIATTSGRFYAMDRDNNWDRLKKVEDAIFDGTGTINQGSTASETVERLHKNGILDEHIEPIVFVDENGNSYQVKNNDGVFFFNFRKDRARMLTRRIIERKKSHNLCLVTMTEYDQNYDCLVAFPPETIETTLSNEISKMGLSQAHIAETEKFAHATYYLNGGRQESHPGEKQVLIESRKDIQTHDQAPAMRAEEITDETVRFIKDRTAFIFVNYANPDMVGHTANITALLEGIEKVDFELGKLIEAAKKNNAVLVVTADHGNAELTFDHKSGQKHTAHTTNPVPFIIFGIESIRLKNGSLTDIAPTILEIMSLKKPVSMTGKSLIMN